MACRWLISRFHSLAGTRFFFRTGSFGDSFSPTLFRRESRAFPKRHFFLAAMHGFFSPRFGPPPKLWRALACLFCPPVQLSVGFFLLTKALLRLEAPLGEARTTCFGKSRRFFFHNLILFYLDYVKHDHSASGLPPRNPLFHNTLHEEQNPSLIPRCPLLLELFPSLFVPLRRIPCRSIFSIFFI